MSPQNFIYDYFQNSPASDSGVNGSDTLDYFTGVADRDNELSFSIECIGNGNGNGKGNDDKINGNFDRNMNDIHNNHGNNNNHGGNDDHIGEGYNGIDFNDTFDNYKNYNINDDKNEYERAIEDINDSLGFESNEHPYVQEINQVGLTENVSIFVSKVQTFSLTNVERKPGDENDVFLMLR